LYKIIVMGKPRSSRFVSLGDPGASEKLLLGLRPLSSQAQQESIEQDEGKKFCHNQMEYLLRAKN
jgi:hypothetical protein